MNNPAIYPPQHNPYASGYGNPMAQNQMMASNPQSQFLPQPSFPPGGFPDQFQRPPSQQPQQRPSQPNFPSQNAGFQRPESRTSAIGQGCPQTFQPQSQSKPQRPPQANTSAPENRPIAATTGTNANNVMAQTQSLPNSNLAQQAQIQNAAQSSRPMPQPTPTLSPQTQARERARVTVLLEINTVLLQEVVSLQGKGLAGVAPSQPQQSPNSPTSTDPSALSNSPVDASKPGGGKPGGGKPASQEYAECMRRLQANLSYLATTADAKKKVGPLPVGPAIMIPPPHLQEVHDLYKRLNQLFPEASQSTINKAMAFASQQAVKPQVAQG